MSEEKTIQTRGEKTNQQITELLKAKNTLLWIVTREERRVERAVIDAAGAAKYKVRIWDCASGLSDPTKPSGSVGSEGEQDPQAVLKKIRTSSTDRYVYVMRDLHPWIKDPMTLRLLRSTARELQDKEPKEARAIVVITPSLEIPPELSSLATVIEYPIPDRAEMERILDNALESLVEKDEYGKPTPRGVERRARALTPETREFAIDAAVGLTTDEAENCYAMSLVSTRGKIDAAVVSSEKKRIIAREKVLSWTDPDPRGMDAVGGLAVLKQWLSLRKCAFSKEARDYGILPPKGVFLAGLPGGGKSLTAKCISAAWAMPLLRIDFGALKSKFVGESLPYEEEVFVTINGVPRRLPIGELVEKHSGDKVAAWTVNDDGTPSFKKVADFFTHDAPGYIDTLVLESGREVRVTGGHSVFVRGEDDSLQEVIADDVALGTRIAAPLFLHAPQTVSSIRPYDLIEAQPDESRVGRKRKVLPESIPLDEDFGEFLGKWAADGTLSGNMVRMTHHARHADHFQSLCERIAGHTVNYVAKTTNKLGVDTIICSAEWVRLLSEGLGLQTGSRNKRVPAIIFTAPLKTIAAFLRGYFTGDGTFSGHYVEATTVSRALAGDIATLLQFFGIGARMRQKKEWNGSVSYRVRFVWSHYLRIFADKIGFIDAGRQGALRGYVDNMKFKRDTMTPNRHIVKGIVFERVVEKRREPYDRPHVYDISVPGTERFIAGYGNVVVHNSETNLRRALQLAEAISPCVLWADEIEKAFAGATGPQGDGGVAADAFGYFLTWMQERKGAVFVVACANDIANLPPEFLRKGRFDEVFWLDLPTDVERAEILRISVDASGRKPEAIDYKRVADACKNFLGAEMAALVPDAMFRAFADGAREITTEDLLAVASEVTPLAKTAKVKIDALREWAVGKAKHASRAEVRVEKAGRAVEFDADPEVN